MRRHYTKNAYTPGTRTQAIGAQRAERKNHIPTIRELIMKFFRNQPDQVFHTTTVNDWVNKQYYEVHGRFPIGVSTDVNQLYHEGKLLRVGHGVYKYRRSQFTK